MSLQPDAVYYYDIDRWLKGDIGNRCTKYGAPLEGFELDLSIVDPWSQCHINDLHNITYNVVFTH